MNEPIVACRVLVSGRVQNVGFRAFVLELAERLGVVGYVRNLPDGRVEAFVEGRPEAVEELVTRMRRGSTGARVETASVEPREPSGTYADFRIRHW
ncbi:acylphosphatase [Candidatus Poribacteria bacterium]|nr:acylphosphatase [Candidatus Poribacteria bacterium]